MSYLLREYKLYLFGFRWIFLLAAFLLLLNNANLNNRMMILLLLLNLVATIMVFYPFHRRIYIFLIIGDLIFSTVLLLVNGVMENPFLLYIMTSFIWLSFYVNTRVLSIFVGVFVLLLNTMVFFMNNLPIWPILKLSFLFLALLTTLFLFSFFVVFIRNSYRKLLLTNNFMRELVEEDDILLIRTKVERVIEKIFNEKRVLFCWFYDSRFELDWEHKWFTTSLLEHDFHLQKNPLHLTIRNITGENEDYFYFPLHMNKVEPLAGILIHNPKKLISIRFNYIYFHLISTAIEGQLNHIKLKNENETAMRLEVRTKMAQDMHDGLAQQLFFLSAQVFHIKNSFNTNNTTNLLEVITHMENQVKQSHLEVRNYIKELRNEQTGYKLKDAVEQLINRITTGLSLNVTYKIKGKFFDESLEFEQTIYRFIEESVNNVIKHAKASQVRIVVDITSVQWTIRIIDNGIGFKNEKEFMGNKKTYGLKGMNERIESLGGKLNINTVLSTGTEIIAIIPRVRGRIYE